MSATLSVVQGAKRDYPLQCWNQGKNSAPVFAGGDTLSAYLYPGQALAATATLAVAWYTASGTQTGYGQGQVQVTITAAQSAALEAAGTYTLIVTRVPSGGGDQEAIWRGTLAVEPAAGSAANTVPTYCAYSEVLKYAAWARTLLGPDVEQEGFYSERLEAREWLDWLIIRSWRGTSAAYFGDAGRSAQFWLGSWVRRTPLPSKWLQGQLAGGFVITVAVTNAGSGYSSAPTVTCPAPPAGTGNTTATLSATLDGSGGIGSIYVNTQGSGYTPGQALNLTISGGGGSNAAATATVSNGTLMLRPWVVRATAYKAISILGLAQIGINNQFASYGAMFRDLASSLALSNVAELDLNADGTADLPIPISPTNTMFT